MRAAIASLICVAVLAGSAVAVARNADTSAADRAAWQAKLGAAFASEANGGNCGCTAAIRAKERVAGRHTSDAGVSK